jgi:hypothetical protein
MKKFSLFLLTLALMTFGIHEYLIRRLPDATRPILWGATFSGKFAANLGLDWKKTYDAMLGDLGVKHLRLPAYWDDIEPKSGAFDFSALDYEMAGAEAHGADVILTVGVKAPRWPECYYPEWTNALGDAERRAAILNYVTTTVMRYKDEPAIRYFQIENEPYLPFGNCAHADVPALLNDEMAAVKKLAPGKPILLTSSIFVDPWVSAAARGDVFGTSLYRRIYTDRFGYVNYPFPPSYFRLKSAVVRFLIQDHAKKFVVIEMQAEPWVQGGLPGAPLADQLAHFDLPYFEESVRYAKEAGFDEYYLWGTEWWYWMKAQQNHPEFWEYGKELFISST